MKTKIDLTRYVDRQKQRILFLKLILNSINVLNVFRYNNGLKFKVVDKTYLGRIGDMNHPICWEGKR